MGLTTRIGTVVLSLAVIGCGGSVTETAEFPIIKTAPATVVGTKATFTGNRSNYAVVKSPTGYSVIDQVGTDGATNLDGSMQHVQFADFSMNLSIGDQAQTVSAEDLRSLIELYIAFFNRVPEADGLLFWIGRYRDGQSVDQIANDFYAAAVQYPSLTGYSPTMSYADFVRIIYANVLGRTGSQQPPEEDVQFWAGRLSTGSANPGTLVRTMLESAHTFKGNPVWGWVPTLLDNKYAVGHYFAVQQGLGFNTPELSIQRTTAIAAAVNPQGIDGALAQIQIKPPQPGPPSRFAVESVVAPADQSGLRGTIRLEVRGEGLQNVELLPPDSYVPRLGVFTISEDKKYAWLDIDTTKMVNGPLITRVLAFSVPAGQGGAQLDAMPIRRWLISNDPAAHLVGPVPPPTSYRPTVSIYNADLPFTDPQPLVEMTQLDEIQFQRLLDTEMDRVRQTMLRYIPIHVSFLPTELPLGFQSVWYGCLGNGPLFPSGCRFAMNDMIGWMNSKRPR